MGVSSLLGYERSLAKRLKASLDFQLSFPNKTYKEMLGTRNFIPGMGYQGMQQSWFPMLIFNVKYRV